MLETELGSGRQQQLSKQESLEHDQPASESSYETEQSADKAGHYFDNSKPRNSEEAKNASSIPENKVDEELDPFLLEFSAQYDAGPSEQLREETMRQWIERSKSIINFESDTLGQASEKLLGYVKSALPVALKLTEFLIEAEKEEHPISLGSIAAEYVLIRSKEVDLALGLETDAHKTKQTEEVIDYAFIMSNVGDDPAFSGTMSRLFALGLLLYELFSGEEPPLEEGLLNADEIYANFISANSLCINSKTDSNYQPRTKTQRYRSGFTDCIAGLKCLDTPDSICTLVGNLLECGQGDSRGDDAYPSFADVVLDLQLMLKDPSRFLNDIETSPPPPLLICNKLYGRDAEMETLEQSHQQHMNGNCGGAIIKGKAGVGKSKLAMHIHELSSKCSGYFLVAKFDQNKDVYPLATIGALFNSLIDLFVRDATPAQLMTVDKALQSALGVQVALIVGILPSLPKIMSSLSRFGYSSCFDSSMSLRFLFGELLCVISSQSRRISLFFDDLHWADPVSLLIVGSLISGKEGRNLVYFACSYRDDEVDGNEQFHQWLSSISMLSLVTIKLGNISVDGVNMLISDALHLSPRVTRPLSSVLHHKAGGGNPLFLRQLMESLKGKGYIFIDLNHPKWAWDLDKILSLNMSDDVVAFLIEEMRRLPTDLQLGLKIASCVGSSVKYSLLDILSKDLGEKIIDILQQVSQKGFMKNVGGTAFCFSHDKIEQAAYEMIPEEERRENHMRFGLAVCAHTALNTSADNDELFFTSINQINKGGPGALSNTSQRVTIAELNLKAGKRAATLLDFCTGFKFFAHGISFLGTDHWNTHYDLSLDLYDAASDAAVVIDNAAAVTLYTQQLFDHTKCSDDKLICMYARARVLSNKGLHREAVDSFFKILLMLGERLPLRMGDAELNDGIESMNGILQNTTDEMILHMEETSGKKSDTLMKIYMELCYSTHFFDPALRGSLSLRMVELTLKNGLCSQSSSGFAFFGEVLVIIGKLDLGIRLGELAMKLVEKRGYLRLKSQVIAIVYQFIFVLSTPLQAIADAHLTGYRAGQRTGDIMSSVVNCAFMITTRYTAGQCLGITRKNARDSALKMMSQKIALSDHFCLLHLQACVLIEGWHLIDAESIDNLPGEKQIIANFKANEKSTVMFSQTFHVYRLVRTFLFRQFDTSVVEVGLISGDLLQKKIPIRPLYLCGFFFEGLTSFQYARQTQDHDSSLWIAKGEYILGKMQRWNEYFPWNFENKMLLLKAEQMSVLGRFDEAESLYTSSIRSAIDHEFIHEQGIASELAGLFFHERGLVAKSYSFLMHSIECYNKWGAFAVAKRVESHIQSQFRSDLMELGPVDDSLQSLFASKEEPPKKRQNDDL
ncbi:hypothetical protein ACHAXR_008700 [Thalassiosira sp. AJA248-18]